MIDRWIHRCLAAALIGATPAASSAQDPTSAPFPLNPDLPPEARQFDFWIGEWDVNLRVLQDDGSWQDQIRSTAHIYPILNGKAVLELWSDERQLGIKGYSLRYYRPDRDAWELWLNWPSANRSGSSSLEGGFRHGRGEFFAGGPNASGEQVTRYTFSDITPTSLRWDDGVSMDGGRSWRENWRMEFSRSAERASWPASGGPMPTWHDGERCDNSRFREYEFLSGLHRGVVTVGGEGPATITGYPVLDGCALLTFVGTPDDTGDTDPEATWGFSHITWNSYVERFELVTLIDQPGRPAQVFHAEPPARPGATGSGDPSTTTPVRFTFVERADPGSPDAPRHRMILSFDPAQGLIWRHEVPTADGGYQAVWEGRFR